MYYLKGLHTVCACQNASDCTLKTYGGKWSGKITPIPIIRNVLWCSFPKNVQKVDITEHVLHSGPQRKASHAPLFNSNNYPRVCISRTLTYQWRSWGLEGLSDWLKIPQLGSGKPKLDSKSLQPWGGGGKVTTTTCVPSDSAVIYPAMCSRERIKKLIQIVVYKDMNTSSLKQ